MVHGTISTSYGILIGVEYQGGSSSPGFGLCSNWSGGQKKLEKKKTGSGSLID